MRFVLEVHARILLSAALIVACLGGPMSDAQAQTPSPTPAGAPLTPAEIAAARLQVEQWRDPTKQMLSHYMSLIMMFDEMLSVVQNNGANEALVFMIKAARTESIQRLQKLGYLLQNLDVLDSILDEFEQGTADDKDKSNFEYGMPLCEQKFNTAIQEIHDMDPFIMAWSSYKLAQLPDPQTLLQTLLNMLGVAPTPSPTPEPTPTATAAPTPSPDPTPSPSATATPSPSPTEVPIVYVPQYPEVLRNFTVTVTSPLGVPMPGLEIVLSVSEPSDDPIAEAWVERDRKTTDGSGNAAMHVLGGVLQQAAFSVTYTDNLGVIWDGEVSGFIGYLPDHVIIQLRQR